jgi:hypothetical protein
VSKDLIVFNGTDVQLTCTINGSPLPNITWFKYKTNENEKILLNNLSGRFYVDNRTGVLSISNTIRNDSGQYECFAQNILGSANARTTLLVRRKYQRKLFFRDNKTLFRSNKNYFLTSNNENCESTILNPCLSCI